MPGTGQRLLRGVVEMDHRYDCDGRCVCGGVVVYFEDGVRVGHGCEVQGRPWDVGVARLDPQVRRDEEWANARRDGVV
jgi:hypothetical protein